MRVLAIGGLDPSGGAGLTVDARMAARLGVHALVVPTALTRQNRNGFQGLATRSIAELELDLACVIEEGEIGAVKLGLVGAPELFVAAIGFCARHLPHAAVVVDPVLSATSGGLEPGPDLVAAYLDGLPHIDVLTPNRPELDRLGEPAALLGRGCGAVLAKGGHTRPEGGMVEDRLITATETTTLRHAFHERGPLRGTGCALAAALAARLAVGEPLARAAQVAVDELLACIAATPPAPDGRAVPLAI